MSVKINFPQFIVIFLPAKEYNENFPVQKIGNSGDKFAKTDKKTVRIKTNFFQITMFCKTDEKILIGIIELSGAKSRKQD